MIWDIIFLWSSTSEEHRNSPQRRTQLVEKPPGTVKTELQIMVFDEIVSWASAWRGTPKHSSKTCSVGQKSFQVHLNLRYRLWLATKSSSEHQRVDVYLNSLEKRTQRVKKYPGKVVPKDVLSGSKNPQVQSKLSNKLWFATKSSPGHQRATCTEIFPKNLRSGSKNPQGHSNSHYELSFATKASSGHQPVDCIKIVPKKVLSRSKNPQVQS